MISRYFKQTLMIIAQFSTLARKCSRRYDR